MARRPLALILALTLAAPAQKTSVDATTQGQTQPQVSVPITDQTFKTTTRLVVVDVVVHDRYGQPVRGLTADDFTVLENGKPESIANFTFTDSQQARAVPKPRMPVPEAMEVNIPTIADAAPLTILLMDALNTPTLAQQQMRQKMLDYLKKLHDPGSRMAVYGLSTDLVMLQDFTTDLSALQRAIEKYKAKPSLLIDEGPQMELPNAEQQLLDSIAQMDATVGAYQTRQRGDMTLAALRAIARATAGYSGRKHLVWLSSGFPEYFQFDDPRFVNGIEGSFVKEVQETTNLLNSSQIAVYPVDASGLVGLSLFSAESSGRGMNARAMTGPQMGAGIQRQLSTAAEVHETMKKMADETGGKAYYNRNDLDGAVAAAAKDAAAYYTLAYYPTNKNWDGKYRKIKVEAKRDVGKLTYRHGYFATNPNRVVKSNDREVGDAVQEALLDPLPATGLTFYGSVNDKSATPQQRKTGVTEQERPLAAPRAEVNKPVREMQRIHGHFFIDPHDITFEKTGLGQRCNLEFMMGVFSGKKLVTIEGSNLDANLRTATYEKAMKEGITINIYADVPKGAYRVRLVLRDNKNGKIGSMERDFIPSAQVAK